MLFLLVILPFTFIQFFDAPWLEPRTGRAPRSVPEGTAGHVILTHFDAVAANLIEKTSQHGIPHVLLVPDLGRTLELHDKGLRVMVGEPDHPETYRRVRSDQAALAVVLNGDLASTNIAATIREVSDRVPIVTDADLDDSLDILELAGSTHVFQFTRLLGQALGRRVLGGDLRANVIGRFDRLPIAEAPAAGTPLLGRTLAESRLREWTGATAVGFRARGRFETPAAGRVHDASTTLVLGGGRA